MRLLMNGLCKKYIRHAKKIAFRGMVNLKQMVKSQVLSARRRSLLKSVHNFKKIGLRVEDIRALPRRRFRGRADKLLAGKLALDDVFKEESGYYLSSFDWNISFSKAATTHQLYLQALNPVGDLAAAYNYTEDEKYSELALAFIESWLRFAKSPQSLKNEYVWDHHAVALRVENILFFFLVGMEREFFKKREIGILAELLMYHGEFLADHTNYLENHNHGVYQDRALLYLSVVFHKFGWEELVAGRLNRQWDFLFNDEMVCVENSYNYQRLNVELFEDIARFCKKKDMNWGSVLLEKLAVAQDFMGYALMPNGICPPFGDTCFSNYSGYITISSDGVMAYATKKGQSGVMPPMRSIVYPKSGYYFGREYWDNDKFDDAMWTMFRSGYTTITHRQADDNSFMLYAKGYNIFVDSGLYTYMFRDPIRIYTRSANSHNTVIVDGTSFCFQRPDCTELCGFAHHEINLDGGYDYVIGFNSLYLGVFHLRHFIFLEDTLFIFDEMESMHEHTYSQLFHCGRDTSIESANSEGICLRIGESGYKCKLAQLETVCDMEVINGADEGAEYGIWSGKFEEYEYIDTVKYNKRGKDICFATLITVEPRKERSIFFVKDKRELHFEWSGSLQSIKLKNIDKMDIIPRTAFSMDSYTIAQKGCNFTFENVAKYTKTVQYAWYIISKRTRKPVLRKMYTESPQFTQDFSKLEEGEYSVRAFIMYGKEKVSQIICHVVYNNEQCSYRRELELDEEWSNWKIERDSEDKG